jgi:hypothetical protein
MIFADLESEVSDLDLPDRQEAISVPSPPLKSRLLPKKRRMSNISDEDQQVCLLIIHFKTHN